MIFSHKAMDSLSYGSHYIALLNKTFSNNRSDIGHVLRIDNTLHVDFEILCVHGAVIGHHFGLPGCAENVTVEIFVLANGSVEGFYQGLFVYTVSV